MNETSNIPPVVKEAHARGALTVALLSDLFGKGVEVHGEEALIVVVLDPPHRRPHGNTATVPTASSHLATLFEGGEHMAIGNSVELYFSSDSTGQNAASVPLALPNGLSLTYGQIVALAGDFYGVPDNPISNGSTFAQQQQYFQAAFNTLANDPNIPTTQAGEILKVMATEIAAVNNAIASGEEPSTVYEKLGDELSKKWNKITGGGWLIPPWYPMGRYLKLATKNFDHFSQDAVTAYTAGHSLALAQAVTASQQSTAAAQNAGLQLAYAMNAFSDHFLSDLFSAGHMRAPRRQLYNTVTPSDAGSYLTRCMHDEDSTWGLIVTSQLGATWRALGDKHYFDSTDTANFNLVNAAVQASADEVWQAFFTGQPVAPADFVALTMIADLTDVQQYGSDSTTNTSPMFAPSGSTVVERTNLNDLDNYAWTSSWTGLGTLAWLQLHYAPAPPTGMVAVPASAPSISSWTQSSSVPPNWVSGNTVRYAVSFTNADGMWESATGPWAAYATIADEAFPTLDDIPTDPTGTATGRNIWRQFGTDPLTFVGSIGDNVTTTFTDTTP